jgi:hypothetical protein
MSQERDGQNPAPPAIDVQSVSVTESGGRRKLTALLGSGEGGGNPLAAAQDLLQSLYRGRTSTRTEPEKPVEAEEESSSWWNPFGGGKKKEAADDGGGSSWWNPFAKKPANDAAEEPSVKPSESGWAGREFGGARADRSKEYRAAADGAKAGTNQLPPDAKEYIYLVVPGLFTEHYPGYMKDNMARMKKLGLDARMVEIDTDASVEDNAKVIRDTIKKIAEAEGKEVVIIGHSKGGVDTTAAMAQYPELYEHVRAGDRDADPLRRHAGRDRHRLEPDPARPGRLGDQAPVQGRSAGADRPDLPGPPGLRARAQLRRLQGRDRQLRHHPVGRRCRRSARRPRT